MSPHRRTIQTAVHMLKSHPHKKDMTFVLLPIAKECLHTSNDLAIDHKDLLKLTDQITNDYGFKFDFSPFDSFKELGLDTWYMQVMTNREKLAPLIEGAKERHHHEIAINYILENKPKHWIEDNHELYHRG